MTADLQRRFAYHQPSGEEVKDRHQKARELCANVAEWTDELPGGDTREKSLAITKLEEAMFWINAHIARHQDVTG